MKKAAAQSTTTHQEQKKSTTPTPDGRTIALQFIDTSWRVALPIIIFCYIGIQLDKHYHTAPLYAVIGLFLSLVLASLLIYKQLKVAYPDFFKKGGTK